MNERRTIIIEEATRTVAFVCIMLLGGLPLAGALSFTSPLVFGLLLLPLLYFPLGVYARLKTGRAFAITTQRGWQILVGVAALLGLALLVVSFVSGPQPLLAMLVGGFVLGCVILVLLRSRWYEQHKE